MRYILLVILVLISFGTSAQAPPMNIGGPQGINVKRILAQDWMSVPIMADTPVAPLTGSGWPGRGYIVFVAQNPDSICGGCPPADTSLWEYTGQRWKRVGMDYLTKLVFGGEVTQSNTFSRRFFVGSYGAFINGSYYSKVPFTTLTTSSKTADSTSRIDAIVLTPLGPTIKVGIPKQVPLKPSISSDEIELSTIYFPPFDTVARFIPVATGVTSVFRVPGKDSIFYSIDTTTFAIKDSIGISVATNGLTANDKTIKLGGFLTENTNIELSTNELRVFSGSDTARFVDDGDLKLISKGSGATRSVINKSYVSSGNSVTGQSVALFPTRLVFTNINGYESYLDNSISLNPSVTLRFPNKNSGSYTIAVTSDTVNLSNRINTKLNISDTAAMLNPYKLTAANGLMKDSTVFRLGGSLNQNTSINLSTRRFDISSGSDTTRFFANGSVSLGATPSDSTYRFNVNGGAKMDSLVVDSLYAKFGTVLATGVPVAPIEFRIASSKTRIDLRPSVAGGWNSNWYGAITHTASETDVLSSSYGSLYLGATNYFGSSGIYLGNTRNNPSMYIRNNNNILVGDTANTGFKFDVNGIARVRDTLTLSTTPVTSDTTANDLLVINSSNGQVRRYTGNWPTPGMPTLQQVTTAGNTTTDSINVIDGNKRLSILTKEFTGSSYYGGILRLNSNANNDYLKFLHDGQIVLAKSSNQSTIYLPDSAGTLTQRVKVDGTTYNTGTNGVVDISGMWINGSATLDFATTTTQTSSDLTITVTGASEGDVVSLGTPQSVASTNICYTAWVSSTNTVTVRLNNYGTTGVDPGPATFKVKVFK